MEGDKSVGIAYFLWLIGGAFGLHHLYLGRDRQAFVWWATWGGFFGIGWLRDIFYIPYYVNLANQSFTTVELAKNEERLRVRPPRSSSRFCGEIMFGCVLGFILQYAIPDELLQGNTVLSYILLLIGPFGTAIGVYVVANIGREQCSWEYPLTGAYIATPLIYISPTNLLYCGITSAVAACWKGSRWRPIGQLGIRRKKHVCKRLPYLTVCGLVYLSLWGSMIYFNATITTKEGDDVKVREALNNFFRSPAWLEMKQMMSQLYDSVQTVGWKKFFEELIDALDPQGESNALKVLELGPEATQEEITARYRKLARTWHPDKHKDPVKKDEAQKKFIEIQQAYETLSEIKAKRSARTKHSRSEF